jgi:hypothetical protein
MTAESEPQAQLGRRHLIVGGAAALAAGGVLAAAPAAAAPGPSAPLSAGDGVAFGPSNVVEPQTSPVTTTIASAPNSGYVYRNVCMYDFLPFDPSALKTWGGFGIYSGGTSTTLRATVEIPAGALVRDVEYYVYNNSGSAVFPDAWVYVPGVGTIASVGAVATVPSTGSITANLATVSQSGPYPFGARLLVGVSTPSSGTVQINGARVGFTQGSGAAGLLATPVRAYDSRDADGKIPAGGTRTITLPASVVGPGTAGVIANITAVDGDAIGFMKVWAADSAEPAASAINFPASGPIANAMVVGVSSARKIKVKANVAVNVIVDITGTIA